MLKQLLTQSLSS